MALAINVDTAGTFTDLLVSGNGRLEWTKADTSPHDLSEGLTHTINDAPTKLGFDGLALYNHLTLEYD